MICVAYVDRDACVVVECVLFAEFQEKGGKRHLVLVKGKSVDRPDEPILFTKAK